MRPGSLSLGFLLLLGGACSQIIGLGDYENTDSVEGSGGDGETGGAGTKGGSGGVGQGGRGGSNSSGGTNSGATAGEGGEPGGGGMLGGAGPEGGVGAQGGVGNAGSGAGGEGGDAGATGGPSTGGTLGTGGAASGGTLSTGGTAGKGGSGGTTGGLGGKGGTGGTTGGSGGKGGTGGMTCTTTDMLLNKNPNFDDSSAEVPDPAPWDQDSTEVVTGGVAAVLNSQAYLTGVGVTAHTPANAAWLGGVGSDYTFTDTKGGTGETYRIYLDLAIPVGATQVTLSCYYQAQTDETASTTAASRDAMIAWLWDSGLNKSAYTFQVWTPSNTSAGWHLFTNTASGAVATALAGKALTLEFYSVVDSARASYFFIDTCSLNVTVCN